MGGCRCYFRNCRVNSYNCPGMHFFHFPLKDKGRCDQWIKYTEQQDFYSLPVKRQKNLTVCARHFRDECFMNYKKDRLTATAVPTIQRLSQTSALDFEQDAQVVITLPQPQQAHLIAPPDFECPLKFGYGAGLSRMLTNEENSNDVADATLEDNPLMTESVVTLNERVEIVGTIETEAAEKRQINCLSIEEITSEDESYTQAAKRHKNDEECYVLDDIVVPGCSKTNSQPIIINHQIMDTDKHTWLSSDTFSIEDSSSYHFVQKNEKEQQSKEIVEFETIERDDTQNNECKCNQLETAFLEIEVLTGQLKNEIEKFKNLETKLYDSQLACQQFEREIAAQKKKLQSLQNENQILKSESAEYQNLVLRLDEEIDRHVKLKAELSELKKTNSCTKDENQSLKTQLAIIEDGNAKRCQDYEKKQNEMQSTYMQEIEKQLRAQNTKHLQLERQWQQQIETLEQSLDFGRQQLKDAKSDLTDLKTKCALIKSGRLSADQKVQELESQLQNLQKENDSKNEENVKLQCSYDKLLKSNKKLKDDYKMLESNQDQISAVTTSNNTSTAVAIVQQPSSSSLTKAQLFNGIKRYISASMSSLLRMEMFGSPEREWKPDERQVSVDILRLGEFVYKYLTDEWRLRLPPLRDVRNWLSQYISMNDEEDL